MSDFDDVDDGMQDALDDAFGERVRIVPQVPAGWRAAGGVDPGRPIGEVMARYRSRPIVSELEGKREGTRFQSMTRFSGASHTLRVSPTQLALYGHEIRANDRVVLIERVDEPIFTITSSGTGGSGGLRLGLVPGSMAVETSP